MKKYIILGLVIAVTFTAVRFKFYPLMDIIEYASIQPLVF